MNRVGRGDYSWLSTESGLAPLLSAAGTSRVSVDNPASSAIARRQRESARGCVAVHPATLRAALYGIAETPSSPVAMPCNASCRNTALWVTLQARVETLRIASVMTDLDEAGSG